MSLHTCVVLCCAQMYNRIMIIINVDFFDKKKCIVIGTICSVFIYIKLVEKHF